MTQEEIARQIEGYEDILKESAILEKYGFDYQTKKGEVKIMVDALHPSRLDLTISEINQETRSAKSIKLVGESGYLPPFQAGQYLNVFVEIGGVRTSRPYSIASSPTQTGYYEITVRRVEDGFVSNYLLDEVKPGDKFSTSSPAGTFHYNPLMHGDSLVFIAGGSGITPFMSMIREVADKNLKRRMHLLYGCRDENDVIYRGELEKIAAAHGNITWDLIVSEPSPSYKGLKGFINNSLMTERLGSLEKMFFLCGPEALYQFCQPQLENLRIPARKIKKEVMGSPKNISTCPGWPQNVKSGDAFKAVIKGKKTIDVLASEPLMISLEKAGIAIPALCRSGECSLCRTKLLAGTVYQPNGVKLRKSDRQFGYIHPCMAYPITDIEILI